MDVKNILHMNTGESDHSYAKNSTSQKKVISKSTPLLEEAIRETILSRNDLSTTSFKIVDLGCSSGPNTLFFISKVLDIVSQIHNQESMKKFEFEVFLNDLPGNDFNLIFKSLHSFYAEKEKSGMSLGSCFISGVPGSFYERLFPSKSLNFVHSSFAVQWLSKVPSNLLNKGNIHIAENSHPSVPEAYLKQFQNDFSLFLSLRSKEMMSGGRMILTLPGRIEMDPTSKYCCYIWETLSKCLHELVDEGLVKEDDIDSFNIPLYNPHEEEIRKIIDMEGSFIIGKLETLQMNPRNTFFDSDDENAIAKSFAKLGRALTEPLLASHFGDHIIDNLFSKFAKHMSKKSLLEDIKATPIMISLINK
ncbi:hypothetical protein ACFE04_009396 [Oxalis oulophora]